MSKKKKQFEKLTIDETIRCMESLIVDKKTTLVDGAANGRESDIYLEGYNRALKIGIRLMKKL